MQGIFMNGLRRPKSKKEVKEAIKADPSTVVIEATSFLGNEYGGPADQLDDRVVYFVGPDPYTKRSFYGTIKRNGGKLVVT